MYKPVNPLVIILPFILLILFMLFMIMYGIGCAVGFVFGGIGILVKSLFVRKGLIIQDFKSIDVRSPEWLNEQIKDAINNDNEIIFEKRISIGFIGTNGVHKKQNRPDIQQLEARCRRKENGRKQ